MKKPPEHWFWDLGAAGNDVNVSICNKISFTINDILTWLRGFQDKFLYLVLFSLCLSLFWDLRDKRNFKNLQF